MKTFIEYSKWIRNFKGKALRKEALRKWLLNLLDAYLWEEGRIENELRAIENQGSEG